MEYGVYGDLFLIYPKGIFYLLKGDYITAQLRNSSMCYRIPWVAHAVAQATPLVVLNVRKGVLS